MKYLILVMLQMILVDTVFAQCPLNTSKKVFVAEAVKRNASETSYVFGHTFGNQRGYSRNLIARSASHRGIHTQDLPCTTNALFLPICTTTHGKQRCRRVGNIFRSGGHGAVGRGLSLVFVFKSRILRPKVKMWVKSLKILSIIFGQQGRIALNG